MAATARGPPATVAGVPGAPINIERTWEGQEAVADQGSRAPYTRRMLWRSAAAVCAVVMRPAGTSPPAA
ncbi:hypothetical protein GCM10010517_53560 [Streptosporangium fragile]|uniref:Uncharacterized protein n=1 Tax=Streptosporangium fragile TaxID=46186 RepID=A0ABP6IJ81_9ACTN